jgi:hypothetical protein
MIRIDAPTELLSSPTPIAAAQSQAINTIGISEDTWQALILWATRGRFVADQPNNRGDIQIERQYLGLSGVDTWCSLGSEIYDYDCWHELDDITKPVPTSYTDVYGTPGETWETWGVVGLSHAPVQIDDKWYRSNLYGTAGERLIASAWYPFVANPNTATTGIIRMITVEEFQDIQQAANPVP